MGLDWLRLHNPLINWSKGKLFFSNCSPCCNPQTSPFCTGYSNNPQPPPSKPHESLGPDSNFSRSLFDSDSPQEIIDNWNTALHHKLGLQDESLLCININTSSSHSIHPKDLRIHDHLRKSRNNCNIIDKYLKEFAPVFSQSGFDELPPRRSWDHAIELKPSEESKPISSKVYGLSRPEQIELDKFLDEHLKTGRICPSKSPIASPFFFVKKKDGSFRPVQDYRRLQRFRNVMGL